MKKRLLLFIVVCFHSLNSCRKELIQTTHAHKYIKVCIGTLGTIGICMYNDYDSNIIIYNNM